MARLDTHVVLWLYTNDAKKLSAAARALIDAEAPSVSPMVTFELSMLAEIGRVAHDPARIIDDLRGRIDLTVSARPFEDVVRATTDVSWTRDPFDRIIVADTIAGGDRLITRDRSIREHFPDAVW